MTTRPSRKKDRVMPLGDRLPAAQFFRDLSIARKLVMGFGILVLLTLLGAGASYLGSYQATTKINSTDDTRVPAVLVVSNAQANLLRMLSDVRGYLALGGPEYQERYRQSRQAFNANLAELDELAPKLNLANQRRIQKLEHTFEDWSNLPERLFALRDDQLKRESAYRLLTTGMQSAGQVLIDVNQMIEIQGQREPTGEDLALLQDMAKFQGNFAAMLSALRGYVTTRNRTFKWEYEVNLTDNQNAWDRLSGQRDALTPSQQALLDNIAQNRAALLLLPQQMFDVLESERWREDLYLFKTEAVPLAESMQQLLDEMTGEQQTLLKIELASGRQDLANANWLTLAGGITALIVGLALAFVFYATIARPVRQLTAVAEAIRGGDLGARAGVESRDEIGTLAATFNNMTDQLRQTLAQVEQKVAERTQELQANMTLLQQEIVERVRVEDALRESEERYRGVVQDTPVLICCSLPGGETTFVNRTYCEYFARTSQELIGSTFLALIPESDRETVISNIAALTVESPVQSHEHQVIAPGGDIRWQRWTNRALFDAQGKVVSYQSIGADITERVRAEEQIKQSLAEKTTLLQELYHRTKNNMQVIYSMLALRAMYVQDEQLRAVLGDVQDKIHSMALVHQKLYESRNLSSINLKEYIDDLTAYLVQSYQVQHDTISLDLETDNVFVVIDTAIPCGLILSELISNALKHAFPGDRTGRISIRLHQAEDESITLAVSDNGIGVPGDLDFIKSASLGLQTVLGIMKHQLRGEISVATDNGVAWQIRFRDPYSSRV